jgi:hypothetical protein
MPKSGDTYNVAQGVGVGRNVNMKNVTVNQIQSESQIDLPVLADQLGKVRAEMKKEATEPEHDVAGAVAAAEAAAKNGDEKSALEHLKTAGLWTLGIAVQLGMPVAIDALKKSAGL